MAETDDEDQGVVKAFRNALRKAWEDGRISYDERNVIAEFSDGLPISQEKVSELEAREYLRYRWREYETTPYDQQLALAGKALEIDPDNGFLWMKKGSIQYLKGDIEGALFSMERSLELDTASEEAWFWKGTAYTSQGDLEAAVECFERAVEQDPDHTLSWVMLSRLERKLGNLDKSKACATRAVESSPDHPAGHIERALTNLSMVNEKDAEKDIIKALGMNPDNGRALEVQKMITDRKLPPLPTPPPAEVEAGKARVEPQKEQRKRSKAKVAPPAEDAMEAPVPPSTRPPEGPRPTGLRPQVVEPEHEVVVAPSTTVATIPGEAPGSDERTGPSRKTSFLDDEMFDEGTSQRPPPHPPPPIEERKEEKVTDDMMTAGEAEEELEEEPVEIVYKVIPCPKCGSGVPITTEERPVVVVCPSCGAKGRIMK